MDERYNTGSEDHGVIQIQYAKDSGEFEWAVIRAIPNGVLLTLDWNQTWALLRVCEHVFEAPAEFEKRYISNHLWANTGFHFMAPLKDHNAPFWFSHGPLNCYVPREKMQTVYRDLKAALHIAGSPERFIRDRQN